MRVKICMLKKLLEKIWNEFIYGGHLLSIGGSAMMVSILIILELKIKFPILVIGYLIPQIIYTYNHLKEIEKDKTGNPERVSHLMKPRKVFYILGIFYLFSLFIFSVILGTDMLLLVSVLMMGGMLFSIGIKEITKKITCFKNIYTSLFWALGPVLIVSLYYHIPIVPALLYLFLFIFLRLIVNTIYFDIKDIYSDKKEKLRTVPVILGKEKTLNILHLINIISFIPVIVGIYLNYLPFFSLALLIVYFYSYYYIKISEKVSSVNIRKLSYIMVDGEYFIWPILLVVMKIFLQ